MNSFNNKVSNEEKKEILTQYSDIINQIIELERKLSHSVKQGNTKKSLDYTHKLLSYEIKEKRNTIKDWKQYGNIFNTSLRRAAIDGGLDPVEVLLISEQFMEEIQSIQDREIIKKKIYLIVETYSTAVFENEVRNCNKTIKEICKYIKVHFNESISTKILADIFHLNSSHLSRQFKKEMNITITAYIQMTRIEEAKHLLKMGKYSITSIAEKVGFNDVQYFTSTFKKVEQKTPSEFALRKQ
ncbi:AraC family transcriptional regulator [Oceanirhabdus sp. W0125-5]|uniref:AraC family transcriptional regulator n=1 Tax=Oceanirhabdus sp. W0125-5 TaxID=2999116 RepID=UPI0022F2F770|nr:AraC family transcriptional regulator [Oceanirhabdus sp. W0125-5]WBW96760.1 AraC family transcriptional regulator [Oceanirhabdus sp. W0125-5]